MRNDITTIESMRTQALPECAQLGVTCFVNMNVSRDVLCCGSNPSVKCQILHSPTAAFKVGKQTISQFVIVCAVVANMLLVVK